MSIIKEKLTDEQLRIAQVIAGILSAAAMIASIFISGLKAAEDNILLQYLFLIVFLVVMVGRRRIESKFRLRLPLYNLVLIDGIGLGVLIYVLILFYYPPTGVEAVVLDNSIKILILAAGALLILILGIALPLKRYFKRKENGTIPPIRLPEKPKEPEVEEVEEDTDEYTGQSAIEKQIEEMTKELDENTDQKDDKE